MTIIIGIDPGSLNTGYGIIEKLASNKLRHIASGVISVKGSEINTRLPIIFQQLQQILAQYQPEQMVIEQVFMAANPNSALKLGMARGVLILAGSLANCAIFELSARQAKKFVTGMGAAKKEQVNRMVCKILNLDTPPKLDASDALALAISHAKTINVRSRIGKFTASLIDRSSLRRLSDNRNNHLELSNQSLPPPNPTLSAVNPITELNPPTSDNPNLAEFATRTTTSTEINSKDLSLARAAFLKEVQPRKRGRPAKVLEISDKNAVENLKINSKRFGVKTGKVVGHNSLEAKIKAILKDKKLNK